MASEFVCDSNILVMGRAAFMRVPVSEANDLNYLLRIATSAAAPLDLKVRDISREFKHRR